MRVSKIILKDNMFASQFEDVFKFLISLFVGLPAIFLCGLKHRETFISYDVITNYGE